MYAFLAVGIGAMLGAWLRWGLGHWLNPVWPAVPLGTLAANLLGAYLIGLVLGATHQLAALAPELRLALVTGFLGALTTFSTFSAEHVTLLMRGQYLWAAGGMAAHLLGSLGLTLAGFATVRALAH